MVGGGRGGGGGKNRRISFSLPHAHCVHQHYHLFLVHQNRRNDNRDTFQLMLSQCRARQVLSFVL